MEVASSGALEAPGSGHTSQLGGWPSRVGSDGRVKENFEAVMEQDEVSEL